MRLLTIVKTFYRVTNMLVTSP